MTGFIDAYLPSAVPGYPCVSTPRFSTTIQVAAGGNERRNQNWEHPLFKFTLPEAAGRTWSVIEALKRHWLAMRGAFRSFPWRDPTDYATVDLLVPNEPAASVLSRIAHTDMPLGTGDGATRVFQLTKTYTVGGETYTRTIAHPVLSSILVGDNGSLVSASDYAVDRLTGEVTFDVAPVSGHALTWGGLFDVEVRFESDDLFEAVLQAYQAGGFADITLVEVRPC